MREWKGRQVYTLLARAESNAFFSRFYKVRNRIESYWDRNGLLQLALRREPPRGRLSVEEGDRLRSGATRGALLRRQDLPDPAARPGCLSSFYYTRTQALPLGGSIVFDYHASRKSQPLEVKVLGRERVETPAGTFDCVAIEPILKAGGIFKNKGRLVIWLTEDARRMPVMMKSKVAIGSISVILQEVRNGA